MSVEREMNGVEKVYGVKQFMQLLQATNKRTVYNLW